MRVWLSPSIVTLVTLLASSAGTPAAAQPADSPNDTAATPSEVTDESAGDGQSPPEVDGLPEEALREALENAETAWFFGEYSQVIDGLSPLLLPEPDPGLSREQLVKGYELLAASLHFQMGADSSAAAFLNLLYIDPDHELDPFVFPNSMQRFFDELRSDHAEELEEIRQARREGETSGQIFVQRTVEERSLVVSMIPFGVGHFINGERGWGAFYLVSEVALGTVSMSMFALNEAARGDDGFYGNPEAARRRQAVQVGTGIAFFVFLAVNVVHGILIHDDVVQTRYEILDSPPDDFFTPQTSSTRGWSVDVTSDGVQIGFGGVF